jgi:hypothetical protein
LVPLFGSICLLAATPARADEGIERAEQGTSLQVAAREGAGANDGDRSADDPSAAQAITDFPLATLP